MSDLSLKPSPYRYIRPFVIVDPNKQELRSSLPIARYPNGVVVHPPYDSRLRTAAPLLGLEPYSNRLLFHFVRVVAVETGSIRKLTGAEAPDNLRRYKRLFLPVYHGCQAVALYHYDRDRRGAILADTQRYVYEIRTAEEDQYERTYMIGALRRDAASAAAAAEALYTSVQQQGGHRNLMRAKDDLPLILIGSGRGTETEEHGMVEALWKTIQIIRPNTATLVELAS